MQADEQMDTYDQGAAGHRAEGGAGAKRGQRGLQDDVAMGMEYDDEPKNCSNAKYLDIQAQKLMGSGSFGKYTVMMVGYELSNRYNYRYRLRVLSN